MRGSCRGHSLPLPPPFRRRAVVDHDHFELARIIGREQTCARLLRSLFLRCKPQSARSSARVNSSRFGFAGNAYASQMTISVRITTSAVATIMNAQRNSSHRVKDAKPVPLTNRVNRSCCPAAGGITASRVSAEQRAQRHDGVAARLQPIENPRQRRDRLRAIAAGVVQENNVAVAPLLFDSLENHVRARPRPILRVDVLEHDEVIEVLRDLQRSEFAQSATDWCRRRRAGGTSVVERPVIVSSRSCVAFSSSRICSGQQSARFG